MTLRLITASLLAALVVVPAAAAEPQPTRSPSPPPDAFERAVRSAVDWQRPDVVMRYLRNHPTGPAAEHPDGFAGVAAAVPRAGTSSTAGAEHRLRSIGPIALGAAGLLGLTLLVRRRVHRPKPAGPEVRRRNDAVHG